MRINAAQVKRITRIAAIVVLGVAILAAAVTMNARPKSVQQPSAQVQNTDPLDAELARCRAMLHPEDIDESCRAAWAEVRRRFFAPHDEVKP